MLLSFRCCASWSSQLPGQLHAKNNNGGLAKVKNLVNNSVMRSTVTSPVQSLEKGNWVKLICGASFEDVADIRNLSLVYTLAGVDCIDCAAEASVVNAVNEGIEAARAIFPIRRPWVMISVNDSEDLHFRKAEFNPEDCPVDCSRPCEIVCPADAIVYSDRPGFAKGGVVAERCYGCGRCLPICPYDKIRATTYIRDAAATAELLTQYGIDAIEIHTSGRTLQSFQQLWSAMGNSTNMLKLVAVSLPDIGELTIPAMKSMYEIMKVNLRSLNLWQLDGRPMSGDIGRGATRDSIKFALHLASKEGRPRGFLQLAGGTNAHTVDGLKRAGLFQTTTRSGPSYGEKVSLESLCCSSHALIGGVAFGGYARKIVGRVLRSVQSEHSCAHLEDFPHHLIEALAESVALVGTVKGYS